MDPIQLIIQQHMAQAVPEWSVSKGWQPVDIGTLSQNMNYQQDINQTLTDPFIGATTGYFNPAAFEPTVEYETPEPPTTPRLAMWSKSPNEIQGLILQGVSEGIDPRIVVKRLTDPGPNGEAPILELPVGDDGKVDTSEFDYYVSEASALRDEVYAATQYEQQLQNPQVKSTTPSAASQKFMDAGFTDPSVQYADEQLSPNLGPARQRGFEGGRAMTQARQQVAGVDARDALLKHAGLPMGGTSQVAGREGWTNIGQDGAPIERLAMGVRNSMDELGGMLGGMPNNASPQNVAMAAAFAPAKALAGVANWAFQRPGPGDEEEPDRNAAVQAELKRRVSADGGPGIGQKVRTGFANFIQNNTKGRDAATTRKNYQHASKNQAAALLSQAVALEELKRQRATGRTPFMDEYMGRAGL